MLASSGDATEPCPVPLSLTNYILDADIRSFFDTVSQDWLVRFVEHRIGDVFRQDMAADWRPLAVSRAKRPDSQVHDFQATRPIALDYGCMPRTKAQSSPPAPGAIAGALPAAQAPQLCQLVTEPPESADWLSEIKFDGYRLIGSINQGRVRLLTRKGLDWADRLPHVAAAVSRLNVTTAMLDGELVALRPDGVASFPDLQALLSEGADQKLHFYVFDLLHLDGWDLRPCALIDRKTAASCRPGSRWAWSAPCSPSPGSGGRGRECGRRRRGSTNCLPS
jgi:ATP-dependent DNA ligase